MTVNSDLLWQACPTPTSGGLLTPTYGSHASPARVIPLYGVFHGTPSDSHGVSLSRGLPSSPHVGGSQSPSTPRFQGKIVCPTTTTASAAPGPAPARTSASLAVTATHSNIVLKPGPPRQSNPNEIRHIVHVDRLAELLSLHPGPSFFSYVCSGMRSGFSIGYAHAPF